MLHLFDGYGGLVDAQDAGGLTRRWAEPARELGEVVRGVQPLDGLGKVVPPRQVIPFGDEVAQRAGEVAERNTAVHAARGLPLELRRVVHGAGPDFLPVHDAHGTGAIGPEVRAGDMSEILVDQPWLASIILFHTIESEMSRPLASASARAAVTNE